jgi:hypothetical protein
MKHASLIGIAALLLGAVLGCVAASAQVTPMPGDPLTGSGVVSRTVNTYATLMSTTQPSAIVSDTNGFGIPSTAAAPTNTFEGTVTLAAVTTTGNLTDVYDPLAYDTVAAWKHLPGNTSSSTSLTLQFVQNGSWLIPVTQGLQYLGTSTQTGTGYSPISPAWHWNIIIGNGRVWNESTDNGYTRASFPFTLAEYNQNCVHNGEMTFLFNPTKSPVISHVFYQIDAEVCEYWQANFYGNLTASYTPATISGDTTIETNAATEIANRIPTEPFANLATDYPSSGVNTSEFIGQYQHPTYIAGYGLYINGVNYVSACQTRTDNYAFCSEMRWPSYSVAKSTFVETALSRLGEQFGSAVYSKILSNYISQNSVGGTWTSTTFDNLSDMASGNYDSSGFETDEDSTDMTDFLDAIPYYNYGSPTSPSKIYNAFNLFKSNYTTPGTLWVYHSDDAFLLTSAMQVFAQGQLGNSTDLWTKTLSDVFSNLNVSQGMQQVMRTACNNNSTSTNCSTTTGDGGLSAGGEPIGAYGMYLIQDDVAKLGYFFNNNDGVINGTQVLDPARENDTMFRTSNLGLITPDSGFYTGTPIVANTNHYNNEYWTKYWTTTEFPPNSGATENGGLATNPFNSTFTCQFWIPYMSGYGGNSVLLLPNNAVYYLFSDDNEFYWTYAVEQINLIKPMCGTGINYPANGATLTSNKQTFQWYMYNTGTMSATVPTAPAPATGYWLDIGKEQGGNEYYSSGNLGTVLSTSVSSLPTDGSTIWARWYYLVSGQWQYNDYTYTAFNGVPSGDSVATMTSPAAPGPLSGSSVTFNWASGSGATAYWLDIGSAPGGNQYYSSGSLSTSTRQATVNGLPTNSSNVYVTLYTQFSSSGQWVKSAYIYTAFNAGAETAVMASPTPTSTLSGSTVMFTWNAGTASPQEYWLDIGSSSGGNNYYSSGNLNSATSTTVTTLPTNGLTVYVTLYTLVSGTWTPNAYTYQAFSASAGGGVLTTPTPGGTLTGSTVTFDWTAGSPGPYSYWMDIGSTTGGNNYYSSGNLGNVTTTTVTTLPTDGSEVFVTLYTLIGGTWYGNAYTYTALNATSNLATMQTPTPGTAISGTTATFTWSSDSSATAYWVDIGSTAGGNDIYSSGNLNSALTTTVYTLPANGNTIYVSLYSYVGGQWVNNPVTYTNP